MITIKHLLIFKEVARVKSMSKAAKNLYISQPSISQKIQEIEEYYHIKLFQRYSKSLGISEEGEIFLSYANKILDQLEEMDEIFFNAKDNITIKIGATLTVGSTIMPELIKQMKNKNPKIDFQIIVDNTQYIENLLLENKLDIAIVEGDINNDNIIKESIIPDQLVFVVNSKHPLASNQLINVKELSQYPFIAREKGSGTRAKFDQFMNRYKISYHISWTCHSWDSIKHAAINDEGITMISIHLIEKEIKSGLLTILNVDNWDCHRTFSVCYHKDKALNDNTQFILQECKNYIHCPIFQYIDKHKPY